MLGGEIDTSNDRYGMITPVFRTSHVKYVWLNATQAIGKILELKLGQGGFIKYDISVVK